VSHEKLLLALTDHTPRSNDILIDHIERHIIDPDRFDTSQLTASTSPSLRALLARTPSFAALSTAAENLRTPRTSLQNLAAQPVSTWLRNATNNPRSIVDRARRSLDVLDQLRSHIDQAPEHGLDHMLDEHDRILTNLSIPAACMTNPHLHQPLIHALTTLDAPKGLEHPDPARRAGTYIQLAQIITMIGGHVLEQMNLTPLQTLITTACYSNRGTHPHAVENAASTHQDTFTRDVIDEILTQADLLLDHAPGDAIRSRALNILTLSPHASEQQIDTLVHLAADNNLPYWRAALNPTINPATRARITTELAQAPGDYFPAKDYLARLDGTPEKSRSKFLTAWTDTTGALAGLVTAYEWGSIPPDLLIEAGNEHTDWTDPRKAQHWADLARNSLSTRHLDALALPALAALAVNPTYPTFDIVGWDDIDAQAARRIGHALDPVIVGHPNALHLITHLAQMPDSFDQLIDTITGLHVEGAHRDTAPSHVTDHAPVPDTARAVRTGTTARPAAGTGRDRS